MRDFASLFVVVLALLLVGCATSEVSSARLTKREAVKIAVAVAKDAGTHLDAFQSPRVTYDSTQMQWFVLFDQKPPAVVGGDVFISVDDKSGVGTLIPSD
jgi:hypothetical protein